MKFVSPAVVELARGSPPNADHVVRGDGDHVVVVVRRGHLVDDDVVFVQRDFSGVLKFWPVEARRRLDLVFRGLRRVFAVLREIIQPERALVVSAAYETGT